MKVFISQPMVDKSDEQILEERAKAIENIKREMGQDDVEILDSFFEDVPSDVTPLWYIGKSILVLSKADIAYFIGDWKKYRGCKAENYLAKEYGIKVMEE